MWRCVIITLGVFASLLPVQVGAQNVGDPCVPTDNCNALLNEECDGSVCVCSTGYETIGGGNQCFAKDCGSLTSPINGNILAYSAGTVFGSVAFYTCTTGYEIDGSDSRACQEDATWSGTAPTCVKKDCGALTVPPNGAIDNTLTTYLEQVVFSCNTGYTLNGVSTLTCTAAGTGTWSSAVPTCDFVDCGILSTPENGGKDASSGTTYLATTTFTCNAGYDLIGSATRTCGADGQWTHIEVVCIIKDCGALLRDADGTLDFSSGTTFGSQATFACNAGFDLIGTSPLVCQADAMWSGDEPTCSIRDCGDLAEPVDGSRTYSSGTTYESIATFSCDAGYDLFGIATINCLNTGNWDESPPVCVVKDCLEPMSINDGNIDTSGGTTYGSVANYVCNTGYTLIGANQRTCQSGGTWSSVDPTCQIVDCGSLTSPVNGNPVALSMGTVFNSIAFYTCTTGYNIDGSETRSCQENATWSGTAPTCVKKDCGALTVPPNGAIDNTLTTYLEQVVFSCNTGYTLNGASTLTCTAAGTGTWSNANPTCDIVDCGILSTPENGGKDASSGTTYLATTTFTCNAGYDLIGSATRTCGADGQWTNTEVVCVIKDCGALTRDADGTLDFSSGPTFGSQATFACNPGFDLIGTSPLVCQADAMWSGDEPTCSIRDCGQLVDPNNGMVDLSNGTAFAARAIYSCDTGYVVNGLVTRVCNSDGTWTGDTPTCEYADCGTPPSIANGVGTVDAGTLYLATGTYTCDTGYILVGSALITCTDTGDWDAIPACSRDCGTPPTVAMGTATYPNGTLSGDTAMYTCEAGYNLSGTATVACTSTGEWTNEPYCAIGLRNYNETCSITSQCITVGATCRDNGQGADQCICAQTGEYYDWVINECLADCGALSDPTNGIVTLPDVTAAGHVARYTCDVGYARSGVAVRVCLTTGVWSGSAPTCITGCSTLDPPVNGYVNTSAGRVAGNIAYYTCNPGYALIGAEQTVCLEDSTWNNNAPTCHIECPSLGDIDHGTVDLSLGHWEDSLAVYICEKDYALVGASTRRCQSTGLWSGVPPDCIFALFPDVLLGFGIVLIVIVLVDVAFLGFCLYHKYGKKKMRNSGRKPRPARITPEGTKNHPPPRKPKIDQPLYKYTVKPKTEIPDPGAGQQPVGRPEPVRQQGNRSSRELQLEDFNRDDPMLSDDSARGKGAPDEDQISLFDAPNADLPTQRLESPEELSARPIKAPTLASEVHEHGNIRARMSVPPVPDPPAYAKK